MYIRNIDNSCLIQVFGTQHPFAFVWAGRIYRINIKTRTKTSIRYAKENDREKRERKKGRRRDIERNVRPL